MTAKISHYTVTNRRTGKVTTYKSGVRASRAADRQDMAYGAIICTRQAHWTEEQPDTAATEQTVSALEERGFRCTPMSLAEEHAAHMSHLDAQGFAAASRQVVQ
jgi:hypothetical protein